jgi:shikimate dehydrogenase
MTSSDLPASRRFAVIGSPIAHSLSPALHRAAHADLGLEDVSYGRFEVTAESFADFVAEQAPRHHGFSVTMPCKPHALAWADRVEPLARRTAAANTLVRAADGSWSAHNTDVHGIVTALRRTGLAAASRGAVIGSGATASSAVAALADLGVSEIAVFARSGSSAASLIPVAAELGVGLRIRPLAEGSEAFTADAVVSTIPSAAVAALTDGLTAGRAPLGCAVLDVVYDPYPSALLTAVAARGGRTASGLEMLLHQAVAQVELMTGRRPDEEPMRAAMMAQLERNLRV